MPGEDWIGGVKTLGLMMIGMEVDIHTTVTSIICTVLNAIHSHNTYTHTIYALLCYMYVYIIILFGLILIIYNFKTWKTKTFVN